VAQSGNEGVILVSVTRIGRFAAALGVVAFGLVLTAAYWIVVDLFAPDRTLVLGAITWLVGVALFGVGVGAMYTWTVDGAFVLRRPRKLK
jgi:hypothetical protein